MKDFIYDSGVRIFYGAGQLENVVQEIKELGDRSDRQLSCQRTLCKAGAGSDKCRASNYLHECRKTAASQQSQRGYQDLHRKEN